MYSGWSPFFSTKFWKNEFVGKGAEVSFRAKNLEGSGRILDLVSGKRKGNGLTFCGGGDGGGGDMVGGGGKRSGNGGFLRGGFWNGLVTVLLIFFSMGLM